MKIRAINYPKYSTNTLNTPSKNSSSMGFEGNSSAGNNKFIDGILNNKVAQSLFKTAGRNPHLIQVMSVGILGLTLRPATLLVVPGAKKEDKQYVAAKSIIGTALFVVSQLLISIPLDKSLKKLAETAQKNPKSVFKQYSSKQIKAYSFLISNAVGLVATFATSSYLTVKFTTKMMNKLFPQKTSDNANNDTQKPQGKERGNL